MFRTLTILSLISLIGCIPLEAPSTYDLTSEEVAYMIGCIEMGEYAKVPKAPTKCADMSFEFLQRHRRPGH